MKKIVKALSLAAVFAAAALNFASCNKKDDSVKTFPVTIQFTLEEGLAADQITDVQLVFSSERGSDTVKLQSLQPTTIEKAQGQYTVTVSGNVKDVATGHVNGTSSFNLYSERTVTVALSELFSSPLIFRTIYTSGSAQYYMLDSYFEIVNNSDEVQYLDQLILSAPAGNQTNANAWQANGMTDLYSCGQGSVIAFPGSGKDYPLQPGEMVVIANEATNHKLAYGTDESQAEKYAGSPDLSKADWEIYLGTGDVDYDAPNMDVIFSNNKYQKAFGLGFFGRSYILAKLPDGVTPAQFAADAANISTTPGTTSSMTYLIIPSKYVLDAVDLYNPETQASEHYCTFLPKDDATGTHLSTAWTGKAVRRKVASRNGSRIYYQDTNSSADDFLNGQDNAPRYIPE